VVAESRDEPVSDLTVVAVVTEWPWPPRNGVTMKSGPLLAALGRRVHVVAPVSGPVPANVVAHPLPMPSRWRFELRRAAALLRLRIAGTAVVPERAVLADVRAVLDAGEQVDVVHLDMPTTGHLVRPLRRLLAERGQHPPVVLSINDSYSLLAAVASPRRGLSRLAQLRNAMHFERRCLPQADLVDVVAPADERWLAREVPSARVRVLPLARPQVTPQPVDSERPTDVVLFSTQVGLDDLLDEVLPEVRSRRPDLSIVMVGGSSDPSAVSRVRALGGMSTGFVPDDELDRRLASAKVLVAPSQQESGTSNKAIRAMCLGTAVVGGRCLDGVPGLVDGTHALVARDPAAIARALIDVLDDDVRRLELAQAGQELALGLPTAAETAENYLSGLRDLG
jgi:glycosyltransferase involved in cell wall biosynthesis